MKITSKSDPKSDLFFDVFVHRRSRVGCVCICINMYIYIYTYMCYGSSYLASSSSKLLSVVYIWYCIFVLGMLSCCHYLCQAFAVWQYCCFRIIDARLVQTDVAAWYVSIDIYTYTYMCCASSKLASSSSTFLSVVRVYIYIYIHLILYICFRHAELLSLSMPGSLSLVELLIEDHLC